jgi:hypothetical protein
VGTTVAAAVNSCSYSEQTAAATYSLFSVGYWNAGSGDASPMSDNRRRIFSKTCLPGGHWSSFDFSQRRRVKNASSMT